jgi:polygalacturonase
MNPMYVKKLLCRGVLLTAAVLMVCGGGGSAMAAPPAAPSLSVGNAVAYQLIPALEALLPAEPTLPTRLCRTLEASLQQTGGVLPASVDADPARSQPDSARIQAAIDACPAGQAVKLVSAGSSNAFLAGPISIKSGVTLWIDGGVTLFASRSPLDYDVGTGADAGYCGTADAHHKNGCNPWITATETRNSGIVGDGIVDGRGGAQLTSGPQANRVTWWDLSIQSKASPALQQNNPRLLQVTGGSGFTLYRITLTNSPKFHVGTLETDHFTGWGVKLITPSLAYTTAGYACAAGTYPVPGVWKVSTCFTPGLVKNTDGFDPGNSTHVTIAYSFVSTGDDNIVPKAGGTGALSTNHLYAHNRFYYGHGMSIGSETYDGLNGMKVWDLVMDGMDSATGLRIKSDASRGGEVQNVLYQSICMRRMQEPLVFDAYYSASTGTRLPDFHDITIQDLHYVQYAGTAPGAGTVSFSGTPAHPLRITLNNVVFDVAPSYKSSPYHDVAFTLGANTNLMPPAGTRVTQTTVPGSATPLSCPDSLFAKFPSSISPI